MLKTFKEKLKVLSKESEKEFAMRISRQVPSDLAPKYVNSLRNLILVMPELILQIQTLYNNPKLQAEERKLYAYLLTYLYHPFDFIPDTESGLFGYLDDAYFVGSVYRRAINHIDYDDRKRMAKSNSLLTDVPEWLELTKKAFPVIMEKIDSMINDLAIGQSGTFDDLIQKGQGEERVGISNEGAHS